MAGKAGALSRRWSSGAFLPDLATSLNNQSNGLSDLGRREEALAAIEKAVTIRRELARTRPTVFASRYASSLKTQAMILSALERSAEAQAVRDEAAGDLHGRTRVLPSYAATRASGSRAGDRSAVA